MGTGNCTFNHNRTYIVKNLVLETIEDSNSIIGNIEGIKKLICYGNYKGIKSLDVYNNQNSSRVF